MASIDAKFDVYLGEQFEDLHQQHEADTLGMWAFLATEVLFFGALFMSFYAYRIHYNQQFREAAHHLKHWIGCVNTGVLLCSSFTVALSVHFAHHGERKKLVAMLLTTMALGIVFLGLKATEYYLETSEGLVPGLWWHPTEAIRPDYVPMYKLFLSYYFIMTAIHATHMLVGLGVFSVITVQAWRGRYSKEYYNPVEIAGLYWHFVDIVWIFLFPTLYLLRH